MVLKRKISAHAVCIDPKKTSGPKKAPTKADIQEDLKMTKNNLKMTKELNDALLEEVKENEVKMEALEVRNKKKDNIIALLEERVKSLEEKNPESKTCKAQTFSHTGSQTEDEDILFCQVCEYPADDLYSLGEHVGEFHSEKEVEDIGCDFCSDSFPSQEILTEHESKKHRDEALRPKQEQPKLFRKKFKFACKFCEEGFEINSELMKHNKTKHTENVSVCWNFVAGFCQYEDSFCWFAHEKAKVNTNQCNSKCNICDLTFNSRPEYLKHRKLVHIDLVPECKNIREGACPYGDTKCWFKHNLEKYHTKEQNVGENIEYNEVVKKLFDIVEKVTERLTKLEKIN